MKPAFDVWLPREAGQPIPCANAVPGTDSSLAALDYFRAAFLAQLTGGISPNAVALALSDWLLHLHAAPGRQLELALKWHDAVQELATHAALLMSGRPPACPDAPSDRRCATPAWQTEPFQLWQHGFREVRQWWADATCGVPGVSSHHTDLVSFCARQWCDLFAPANFPWSNPEVLERTAAEHGLNLLAGMGHLADDLARKAWGLPEHGLEDFKVGVNVAVTPGAVVFRNHLIELIQYAPSTDEVRPEPILITPAWIMKYYVLDLSPGNSLIRYLVAQGFTVFCISWRNVSAGDRDLSLEDYRRLGFMAALDAVNRCVPGQRVHAVGYCLGGTLLSIAAAAMASQADDRLATITLLAAQTDFSEPGGLGLYIDASEVHFLESVMWAQGYLSADQMAAAFQSLRPIEDVAGRAVRTYLLGERAHPTDLVAWNADSTHMPYRMHAEYLRKLFLENELAAGRYEVDGRTIALRNIRTPIFALGTVNDHIAPWRSVFKLHYLTDADIRFVLTSGGHNAGVVSEPGHPGRWHRLCPRPKNGLRAGPDDWLAATNLCEGSWWPTWVEWLAHRSGAPRPANPRLGEPDADSDALMAAPGSYVRQG
ncbi:alpha/beta hydrolase [Achromobacter sp. NFACC18-2]|uniref:PHA/PHB synthase family protein n=1 Tax=Achromobacter sp. NFACC18-2 TaxID=1564112 RepID=UPI0008B38778|nr:alpha/beta fold hydrolase [Achromobacter sp. NFACC18-2]SEI46380.1 polyhydroxyalkanoate synthase [Achromobacter sp. NFACC18-2]